MSFTAKYRGICDDCEEDIEPGQIIASTYSNGYVHVVCPNSNPPELIMGKVCSGCFQVKALNGSCGCEA